MRKLFVVTIVVLALTGAVAQLNRTWLPEHGSGSRMAKSLRKPHGADQTSKLRTVIVGSTAELGSNDGTLLVGYETGPKAPSSAQFGEVITDENCQPDAHGVSHCRNNIRMKNGAIIRVQHAHRMHEVPCLLPGERVRLRAA